MTAPDRRYLDGWQDAIRHVRHELTAEALGEPAHCIDCLLDRSVFAGIVAALDEAATPAAVVAQVTADTADYLVKTAMDPDLEHRATLPGLARQLITEQPGIAAELVTIYALTLGRHYAPDTTGDTA